MRLVYLLNMLSSLNKDIIIIIIIIIIIKQGYRLTSLQIYVYINIYLNVKVSQP